MMEFNNLKRTGKKIMIQAAVILNDNHGLEAWEIALGVGLSAVLASYFLPGGKEIVDSIVNSAKSQAASIFS